MQGSAQGFESFSLIALTLPGSSDPSVAIAASRAGEIGVLDLQYFSDEGKARAALSRLARYGASRRCGIRLEAGAQVFAQDIIDNLPAKIGCVILVPTETDALRELVQRLREQDLTILLETTSLEEARLGEELGVQALIAKGHEAGGRVGEETAFILSQQLLAQCSLPVLVQGGIGLHSAAACYEAGAAGVVLDAQLALVHESPVPESIKASIARMDGSETICLGANLGEAYRLYHRPGLSANEELRRVASSLAEQALSKDELLAAWRREMRARVCSEVDESRALPLGQDAAFAAPLAERFRTVGGVLEGFRQEIDKHIGAARALKPLDQNSPLAVAHRTRYPLVQGPMTRVSDRASFAAEVAKSGGLPFLALALMRAPEVRALLEETQALLGDKTWGVGILGFVPLALREEQLEVIQAYKPPFALIAGGRPDQALTLERAGIPTYLHVPSPGLLKLFIENGARRFVFEGRECGGHVGPRSSFVLWNMMIDMLLESFPSGEMTDCHVLFAGGIHDALSSSMVATMAAPLAERGAKIGALLGTAYLFTREAVETGAIIEGFQQEAIECRRTVLLESGPGHSTRCVETPFAQVFEQEKRRLAREGKSAEEIRAALEDLNVGRLRIASKGINRHPLYRQDPQAPKFINVSEPSQHAEGMYMIGQVAALRDETCTIEELHREVSVKGSARLAQLDQPSLARVSPFKEEKPCDVAIIGMACLLPKAPDWRSYWENILHKVDAIVEVPPGRFDWKKYFDANPNAPDKIYSRWGGFLDDVAFDPLRYGMPPNTLPSIEPLQILTLEVVRAALQDAGYLERPFPRQRTSVILGAGGGVADLGNQYAVRSALPSFFDEVSPELLSRLPEWTEDSFPGILLNVVAGRVANRFDLGGVNYTVDAACASSLAAVYMGARELETGASDMVIVGGGDTVQNHFAFLCFSKTHALSPTGRCRTFDEKADGIAISEGIAVIVLKRLADAERDGDHIYAVLKGIAGSSDGRDKSLTAPRPDGQALALERAYAKAGFSPSTVELVEAHGTGTVAGDQAEVETLKKVFGAAGASQQGCAIGSVKSMIGHTKCTAGVAGMMKVALALQHKVLPPTMNVEKPNPKANFPESPFYVNTELRPWIHHENEHPRRAGVSAFGFGGTNFHAVLEEYTGNFLNSDARQHVSHNWSSELLIWTADFRQEIIAALSELEQSLVQGATPALRDLAYTLWQHAVERKGARCLSVITTSLDDLRQKLAWSREALQAEKAATLIQDVRGIYYTEQPLAHDGKIAFLFSGQGSQYPDMLRQLATHFTEVREQFELADRSLLDRLPSRLSSYIFPPPRFSREEEESRQQSLTRTNIAQPALGAVSMGLFYLLRSLGVSPQMVAGHSYGEYAALCSAGVFDEEALYKLSEARGRCIIEAAGQHDLGTMAAVMESPERVASVLESVEDVWVANVNAPRQTVISGTRQGIERASELLVQHKMNVRAIPVACAFHSPVIGEARDRLASILSQSKFNAPRLQVFSNTSAAAYPDQPSSIVALLSEHLVNPVRFADEVSAMYDAGARVFVEVGPRNVLAGLASQILSNRPHLSLATDVMNRDGLLQLQHTLGQLASHGVPVKLDRLYEGREARRLNLKSLVEETRPEPLSPTTWMVNGGRARPLREMAAPKMPAPRVAHEHESAANGNSQPSTNVIMKQPNVSATIVSRTEPKEPSPNGTAVRQTLAAQPAQPGGRDRAQVPAAIPTQPATNTDVERVMVQFQELMGQFLETQQQIMLAYLQGSASDAPSASYPEATLSANVLPQPQSFLGEGASPDVVAVSPQAKAYEEPLIEMSALAASPVQPVSVAAKISSRDEIQSVLLELVSEKTGYPTGMLDLLANMEADLGIDSIKRVEILGALERRTGLIGSQMEQVSRLRTLQSLIDFLSARPDADAGSAIAAEANSASSSPPQGKAELTEKLLQIVSERTGYPPEMLDLDLNMEADLGIDSIKRVEILGTFQRACFADDAQKARLLMEKLTGLKTLRAIVDAIQSSLDSHEPPPGPINGPNGKSKMPLDSSALKDDEERAIEHEAALPRFLLTAVDAPLTDQSLRIAPDSLFLITDDWQGVAQSLADALRSLGARAVIVRMAHSVGVLDQFTYAANLSSESDVADLMRKVRLQHGPLAGVVHLAALMEGEPFERMDISGWRERLRLEVKSLFLLAKAAGEDFKRATREGRGWLVAATSMGGTFASYDATQSFLPSQGGIGGLVKTLATEWPGVHHKVIDFDTNAPAPELAQRVLAEMTSQDEDVEVGYKGARRLVLRAVVSSLDQESEAALSIKAGDILLVTGGARGITAEVACELANRYQPTILLAGRSPMPEGEESKETAAHSAPRDVKAALMERMRRDGQAVSPALVEAAYARLLQDREMRAYVAAMKRAGATVRYYPVDVRDEAAFGSLIDNIYETYGRIDGVIHGAGVIEDKLIEDKAADSFDRVFETKALSAFILSRKLRPASLKFLVLFSSISGRFGNRGQGDYAAANELMNKLAVYLDGHWPGRVAALNWGPWEKTGMASSEVQKQFAERAVQIIKLAAGRRATIAEIIYGRKGEVEVVLGGGPWKLVEDRERFNSAAPLSTLGGMSLSALSGD
jgi:acyl transferase domain-containing protein/NAD(P)H-dependent flavin oxidoreductase YrpB (nitropropane dioxygenase family)/NAD(P)-dependent dehydrogenase (short-subunit alcohol dehydrogenase family)